MATPIDKDYVCVIDEGQKKPISPITHTKTIWDEQKQKYVDVILKDLENTVGLPVTTSLDITEEGKFALDAKAGHRLNELCEKVFRSADDARDYLASVVGIDNPEDYNLTTLANKVREYMNSLGQVITNKGGQSFSNPTFPQLMSGLNNMKNVMHEYTYTFYLSYNDLACSWDYNKNGSGIMDHYEPWGSSDKKRNYVICLSKATLMRLSGKNYIPPYDNIHKAEFDYPVWETKYTTNNQKVHYKSYIRDYSSYFYSNMKGGRGCPCMSLEEIYDMEGSEDVSINSRFLFRGTYDGYTDGDKYYSPFNAFNHLGDLYNPNQLYVRIDPDAIKQYWSYFIWYNNLNTSYYTKSQLSNLKNMRGETTYNGVNFGVRVGIPFTLKLMTIE